MEWGVVTLRLGSASHPRPFSDAAAHFDSSFLSQPLFCQLDLFSRMANVLVGAKVLPSAIGETIATHARPGPQYLAAVTLLPPVPPPQA